MSASLIGWILTLLIVVILVYSILMGVKRGLGKSLFRLAWLLVFAVILFFVTPIISNAINNIDISGLNLDIYGQVKTLSDIGTNLVEKLAESNQALADSKALLSLAQSLPAMLLSIPLFVLLFFITKWLLWPIWAIIASKVFDKQKRAQKRFKKQQAKLAKQNGTQPEEMPIELTVIKKKNRLGGAVIGLVIGLVMSIIVFMPLVGLNNMYQNIATIKVTQEDGSQVSLVESQINDQNVVEYLSFYEDSVASKVLTYTGVGFVSNAMFGYLTTAQVNDEKISLSSEVSTIAKAYDNIYTLMNLGDGELTQQKLDRTLTAAKELLVKIKDSTLVNVLGDDIIPLFINNYLDQENLFIVDGGEFDELIIRSYRLYSRRFNTKDLENQLENLVDVLVALNNSDLIVPIANGTARTLDDILTLVGTNVTAPETFTKIIVNNLYEVTMFSDNYRDLIKSATKSVFDTLELNHSDYDINNETLKGNLENILKNFVDFARYYNQSNNMDFGDNERTMYAFNSLGKTLDILKANILGENNFASLLNYAINTLNETINNALGDFSTPQKKQNSEKLVKDVLDSLAKVEIWGGETGELYAISTLYSNMIKVVNNQITTEKFLDPTYTAIEDIGIGITSAMRGNSKLITNANIARIVEVLLDKVESSDSEAINEILNIEIFDKNSTTATKVLRDTILNNIYDFSTSSGSITASGWTNEFKYNVEIFKKAYKVITNEITTEELTSPNNYVLQEIGNSLDKALNAKANLIFNEATMRGIIEYYLNKIEMPEEATKIFNTDYIQESGEVKGDVKAQVLKNIYDPELKTSNVTSWEQEFLRIKNLLGANFEVTNIAALGEILDGILGSRIFTRQVINSVVIKEIDKAVQDNSLDYLNSTDGNIGGIDAMKRNLTQVESYKKEFSNLQKLIDIIKLTEEDSDRVKLRRIGEVFDEITNVGVNEAEGSKMLTTTVVNEFVRYYFNDYVNKTLSGDNNKALRDVISTILENLNNINDYSRELENIVNVAETLGDSEKTLIDVGRMLDSDNIKNSKLINTKVIRNLVIHFIDENTKNIESGLGEVIETLKVNVANENIIVNSYEREFGYLDELTEIIMKSSSEDNYYSEVGKVLNRIRGFNSETIPSRLINQPVVSNFIIYYFDAFKQDKLDEEKDEELIIIVDAIKDNVTKIVDYQKELTNIQNLFKVINVNDNEIIGDQLDSIKGDSNLITNKDINDIVLYYFNKEAKKYEINYENIISSMRLKLEAIQTKNASYRTAFAELSEIITAFGNFDDVKDLDSFTATSTPSETIGANLDSLEKMTTICDGYLTKELANIVVDKLKGFATSQTDETLKTELILAIDTVLQGGNGVENVYDFANYYKKDSTFSGNYAGETYYSDLLNSLYTAITQAQKNA